MDENNSKSVSFNNIAKVILIPCREELEKNEGGHETLWWSKQELRKILHRVKFEITSYAHKENISVQEAAKKLYGLRW